MWKCHLWNRPANKWIWKTLLFMKQLFAPNFFYKSCSLGLARQLDAKSFWSVCMKFSGLMCLVWTFAEIFIPKKGVQKKFLCCHFQRWTRCKWMMYIYVIPHPAHLNEWHIQGVPEVAHHADFMKIHINNNFIDHNHNRCSHCSPSALKTSKNKQIIIWWKTNKLLYGEKNMKLLYDTWLLGHPVYIFICQICTKVAHHSQAVLP